MRQTTGTRRSPGEKIVKDIKRATRKHYSSEDGFSSNCIACPISDTDVASRPS